MHPLPAVLHRDRIQSVDTLRLIAIFAVIVIHTAPFAGDLEAVGTKLDLALVLNQLARFAVPYFFLISGYFWATKFADAQSVQKPTQVMARRIIVILLAWSTIYLLPTNLAEPFKYGVFGPVKMVYWNVIEALKHPGSLFFQSTKYHLWFLMSLLICLTISGVLISRNMVRSLIFLSLILYLIGLMGKAYADTPVGFHLTFNLRNGPFFGLIFFVTGYLLQRLKPDPSWFSWGLALSSLGVCLHFGEIYVLNRHWGTSMNQDYLFGTYFFGVGAGLMALSNNPLLRAPRLSFLGPLVLGIYAVHVVFVDLLQPLHLEFSGVAIWEIGYPIVVLILSIGAAYGMSRVRLLRPLVA
jgi:surface polysaccharide O-acyltransferase-like enzyme